MVKIPCLCQKNMTTANEWCLGFGGLGREAWSLGHGGRDTELKARGLWLGHGAWGLELEFWGLGERSLGLRRGARTELVARRLWHGAGARSWGTELGEWSLGFGGLGREA